MTGAFDAFVLAGGISSRMGTDKAWLHFDGSPLIERALQLLRSLGGSPKIVGSRDDLARFAPVVPDLRPGCGPLSGIEAGLAATGSDYALFVPVDTPLLPAGLLRLLLNRTARTGALLTVPRFLGREQPLSAVYHRCLLPAISAALDAGEYKVLPVLMRAAQQQGGAQAGDVFDIEVSLAADRQAGWPVPAHSAFLNCNTPADLRHAGSRSAGQQVQ